MGDRLAPVDYRALFDLAPVPLVLLTPDLVVVRANREWSASTATRPEAAVGRRLLDVFPTGRSGRRTRTPGLRESLERARDRRRLQVLSYERCDVPPVGAEADPRVWTFRTVPIVDAAGEVVLLLHSAIDITDYVRDSDEERLRAAQWRTAQRIRQLERLLAARGRELDQARSELRARAEGEQRTARSLTGLARTVSALAAADSRDQLLRNVFRYGEAAFAADALAVALFDAGGGRLTVVDTQAVAERRPGRPVPADSPLPVAAAATGTPVFQSDAQERAATPPPLPGLRSWAALPLHSGRRPLGSITVGWRRPHRFGDTEVEALEAFAAQCAQAVDRVAWRDIERRRAAASRGLAEVLQRSMLSEPPRTEHLDIAVRYRPAAREALVGGDWYDAFPSSAGGLTVAVGDVTGHDRTAAVAAGQLRSMLRGIVCALEAGHPAEALATLDRALGDTEPARLATALVAHVQQPPSAAPGAVGSFRWSSAGHPPPLLIERNGTATLLDRPNDLLLGVQPDVPRHDHAIPLRPGATVVLYTDGLIEHRGATLDDGLARLVAAAPDLAGRPVHDVCDEILTRLAPELTDDIALLALRVRTDASGERRPRSERDDLPPW